jgi:hypothetical protein
MKLTPIATGFALLLAGCAPTYDRTAVPDATLALHQVVSACEAKQSTKTVKNYSEFTACEVAAERNFAAAIHLQHMDAFETYAAQMLALAADRDAGLVNLDQVKARAAAIRQDYWAACACNITGRRIARWGGMSGPYESGYNGGMDAGPAMIGGVVWNGR